MVAAWEDRNPLPEQEGRHSCTDQSGVRLRDKVLYDRPVQARGKKYRVVDDPWLRVVSASSRFFRSQFPFACALHQRSGFSFRVVVE